MLPSFLCSKGTSSVGRGWGGRWPPLKLKSPLLHLRTLSPSPCPLGSLATYTAILRRLSTPVLCLLVPQFPFFLLPWCSSCPHFISEGSVSPTSCLGAPPPLPISQYLFPEGLVADSGLESGHSDLSGDDPRAVPEAKNSPSLPGTGVFGRGGWVSNLGHFLTLSCPLICQQTASPSQRPTHPCPKCLSCPVATE